MAYLTLHSLIIHTLYLEYCKNYIIVEINNHLAIYFYLSFASFNI